METYQNLCTEYYDLDKPAAPKAALDFYLDYVKKAQGPILEPMSGSGRFLIPFLEQGYAVEGLDISLPMLKACMKKCAEKKLEPILYSQFLTEMSLDKQYALIFIPSSSFGLITDKKQAQECLKNFYDHLLPNGKLVLEIETTKGVPNNLGMWHGSVCDKPDGSKIILSKLPSYDQQSQILQTLCRYESLMGNHIIQTEIENINVRLYKHDEFDSLLEDAGFKDIMRFKLYSHAEPDENDEEIVYECRK